MACRNITESIACNHSLRNAVNKDISNCITTTGCNGVRLISSKGYRSTTGWSNGSTCSGSCRYRITGHIDFLRANGWSGYASWIAIDISSYRRNRCARRCSDDRIATGYQMQIGWSNEYRSHFDRIAVACGCSSPIGQSCIASSGIVRKITRTESAVLNTPTVEYVVV